MAVLVVGLAGACSRGSGGPAAATSKPLSSAAIATTKKVHAVAQELGEAVPKGDPATACKKAATDLDKLGSPNELARVAAEIDDPAVQEAALDQQAAVSSMMAACRRDAPLSPAEAATELREASAVLEVLLAALKAPGQ